MGESTGDLWLHTRNQSRWRHQIETFSVLLTLCAGNSPVIGEFPTQRPVTWSFDVFCVLSLNKRLSKESWGWWFETPPRPLWRHCNEWCRMCFLYTSSSMVWWKYPLLSKQTHNVMNTLLSRGTFFPRTNCFFIITLYVCLSVMKTSRHGNTFHITCP